LLLTCLFVIERIPSVVLDLVEGSGDRMEETETVVSNYYELGDDGNNLRADDSQDESTPWKVARVVVRIRRLASNSVGAGTIGQTPRAIAMTSTSETAMRTRQH
jgi:hypothetical protein